MIKSSKHSKTTSSPDEIIREVIGRVEKFKAETDDILAEYQLISEPTPVTTDLDKTLENIFLRFHCVAVELTRRHNNRPTIKVENEYDAQDLLHGLLRVNFEDIQDEEWTPSYAGGCSRIDFLLRDEEIAIEVKMTRDGLRTKKVREQIIIDKVYYRTHPKCKKLYCFVYDPRSYIKNPRGFEKDLHDDLGGLETKVYVVPR